MSCTSYFSNLLRKQGVESLNIFYGEYFINKKKKNFIEKFSCLFVCLSWKDQERSFSVLGGVSKVLACYHHCSIFGKVAANQQMPHSQQLRFLFFYPFDFPCQKARLYKSRNENKNLTRKKREIFLLLLLSQLLWDMSNLFI